MNGLAWTGARPVWPRKPRDTKGCALALVWITLMGALPRVGAVTPALIWSDEFNQPLGSGPDPTKWSYDLGVGNPPGWGNNELETYTNARGNSAIVADPAATDGKALAIVAQAANGGYTSARIYTNSSFTACRLEARARMPTGAGLWPAFWALGSNINTVGWPACGEVDVMEWGGSSLTPAKIQGSLHSPNYNPTTVYPLPNSGSFSDAYHVFAADCYPNEVVFSVDGTVYEDLKESEQPAGATWPFDAPFFILLNLAVGGNYPASPASTVFPQTYLLDYVRVYSLPSTPPPNLVWPPSPPANLSAYSPATAQINVSWQPSPTAFGSTLSGYTLARATDAAFTQNVTTWNMGLATSYLDTSAQAGSTYYYRVIASGPNGTSDPSGAVLSSALAPASDSILSNISSRAFVETGGNVAIAGFVIAGSSPETVLIRASGPVLSLSPFKVAGTLPDPLLQLNQEPSGTMIKSNQGWAGDAQVAAAATAVGAYVWSDSNSADSALLETLPPGGYTAVVSGASGDTGVSLVEVYAVPSQPASSSNLLNISSRAFVGTGGNVLIAGFVIGGSTPKTVLIRASGPALSPSPFNVPGTLPDPLLQLNQEPSGTLIASNQGWAGNAQVAAAATAVGAYVWSDSNSTDSALLATLPPGPYTAVVSGASGDTGVSLVEVYAVQ